MKREYYIVDNDHNVELMFEVSRETLKEIKEFIEDREDDE